MKRPLLAAALVLMVSLASSQPAEAQDSLEARRDKKLAGAWLKNAAWHTDWDKASAAAKESGKPLLTYFTRSYAP